MQQLFFWAWQYEVYNLPRSKRIDGEVVVQSNLKPVIIIIFFVFRRKYSLVIFLQRKGENVHDMKCTFS